MGCESINALGVAQDLVLVRVVAGTTIVTPIVGDWVRLGHLSVLLQMRVLNRTFTRQLLVL